jgi:hypothetical protein
MTNIPNDKRAMNFGSAFAIQDPETLSVLQEPLELNCLHSNTIIDEYLDSYDQWIGSTKQNTFIGLEDFEYRCYSQGTTESFDKFYLVNSNKRFRCFRGEYMYHKLAWRNGFNWIWLEDDELRSGDAVVISLPFADTGDKHNQYDSLMERCTELDIPVLVDCAYFGICHNIEFDFDHPCITDIVFSLSKTFPVAYARIGMRYSRVDNDDTLFVYHKIHYNNKIGAKLGLKYLNKFSPDFIASKYLDKQKEFCNTLEVDPTNTVLFGIGGPEWKEYSRGGLVNRLSFHKQYISGLDYDGKN